MAVVFYEVWRVSLLLFLWTHCMEQSSRPWEKCSVSALSGDIKSQIKTCSFKQPYDCHLLFMITTAEITTRAAAETVTTTTSVAVPAAICCCCYYYHHHHHHHDHHHHHYQRR